MINLSEVLSRCSRKTSWGIVEDPIAQDLLASSSLKKLEEDINALHLSYLEPLSAGLYHLVLDMGDNVLRIGFGTLQERLNIPEILQPIRSRQIDSLNYEILPKADTINVTQHHVDLIIKQLNEANYIWNDAGIDNIGLIKGKPVIIDSEGISEIKNNHSYKIK